MNHEPVKITQVILNDNNKNNKNTKELFSNITQHI